MMRRGEAIREAILAVLTVGIVATFLAQPPPVAGQLQGAAVLDVASSGSALSMASGAGAIGTNPAALGLSAGPGWSVALLPVVVGRESAPIGWGEVDRWSGDRVPVEERQAWLERIESAGSLRARLDARVTAIAVQTGPLGVQVSSRATGQVALNEGVAELLLFGNAGRTGQPAELDLRGSTLDLEAITSAAVAWGRALRTSSTAGAISELAAGLSLAYHEGHFMVMGRDDGSAVRTGPSEVELLFPVLESVSGSAGRGMSLSLGAVWRRGPMRIDAAVHDVIDTFGWREEAFRYRPAAIFLSGDGFETATELRPVDEAPSELRNELAARGLAPRVHVGAAFTMTANMTLTGELARGAVGDLPDSPSHRVGVGVRHVHPVLPVAFQAGIGATGDGPRLGGGLEVGLGRIALVGALLGGAGTGGSGLSAALGLELRAP